MKKLPKISVIIPVYNVELYIAECLQSVMRQTYKGELECVIVDDCGTDKSIEIAEQLIAAYDGSIVFRVLHHEHNRGLSAARNTGIAAISGDYLFFLDSDDYLSNDCFEVLTTPLQFMDYDMVIGDLQMTSNPYNIVYLPKEEGQIIGNTSIFHEFYVERTLYVMAWNKLIKTSLFKNNDLMFLEGQLHEDNLWTYKTLLCIDSIYVKRSMTYFYRIRNEGNIMSNCHSNAELRLWSFYQTVDYMLRNPAKVPKDDFDRCVAYHFGQFVRYNGHTKKSHRNEYVDLRRRFKFHPIRLFLTGRLPKHLMMVYAHLALPPLLGYSYLLLRKTVRNLVRRKRSE